jgi:hypothetical protein
MYTQRAQKSEQSNKELKLPSATVFGFYRNETKFKLDKIK